MAGMFEVMIAPGASLRPIEPWQAEEFFAHVDRIRDHLAPWVPVGHRVVDVATAREMLQDYADRQARDTGRIAGIYADGALVGGVVLPQFQVASAICEVGIWLDPPPRVVAWPPGPAPR
jgi:ribosomal-protein-serine acetyltransferase